MAKPWYFFVAISIAVSTSGAERNVRRKTYTMHGHVLKHAIIEGTDHQTTEVLVYNGKTIFKDRTGPIDIDGERVRRIEISPPDRIIFYERQNDRFTCDGWPINDRTQQFSFDTQRFEPVRQTFAQNNQRPIPIEASISNQFYKNKIDNAFQQVEFSYPSSTIVSMRSPLFDPVLKVGIKTSAVELFSQGDPAIIILSKSEKYAIHLTTPAARKALATKSNDWIVVDLPKPVDSNCISVAMPNNAGSAVLSVVTAFDLSGGYDKAITNFLQNDDISLCQQALEVLKDADDKTIALMISKFEGLNSSSDEKRITRFIDLFLQIPSPKTLESMVKHLQKDPSNPRKLEIIKRIGQAQRFDLLIPFIGAGARKERFFIVDVIASNPRSSITDELIKLLDTSSSIVFLDTLSILSRLRNNPSSDQYKLIFKSLTQRWSTLTEDEKIVAIRSVANWRLQRLARTFLVHTFQNESSEALQNVALHQFVLENFDEEQLVLKTLRSKNHALRLGATETLLASKTFSKNANQSLIESFLQEKDARIATTMARIFSRHCSPRVRSILWDTATTIPKIGKDTFSAQNVRIVSLAAFDACQRSFSKTVRLKNLSSIAEDEKYSNRLRSAAYDLMEKIRVTDGKRLNQPRSP